jgi:hypothetical protein
MHVKTGRKKHEKCRVFLGELAGSWGEVGGAALADVQVADAEGMAG